MIEISAITWLKFLFIALTSTAAGLSVSYLMPWSTEPYRAKIPVALGIAMAPLLLGISCILSLSLLPGSSHQVHMVSTVSILLLLSAIGLRNFYSQFSFMPFSLKTLSWQEKILCLLLLTWALGLIFNALFFPLTKNDALEYATVGRILFEKRNLIAYPVLDPIENSAGFYGPWTHPPLYVAIIYLFNILQENASLPLLKIVSVWCSLGTAYLMYAMGSIKNRKTGLFTAILFLSCPLYYLGAAEGLIDPLPVLGMTLILSLIISLKGPPWKSGLYQGAILGVALWTHSQAILFVPLMIVAILTFNGIRRFKNSIYQILIGLSVAFILSFYPYLKNYQLYGSFISDQPLIFELNELNWVEYFSISRGFYTLWGKIQAGLFKGWFVFDAYSMLFWIMTLGIILSIRNVARPKAFMPIFQGSDKFYLERVRFSFLSVIICYLMGVVLSLFLNIDLMIRNERYLLIILPAVSLFAADAMEYLTTSAVQYPGRLLSLKLKKLASVSFLFIFVSGLFSQFLVVQIRQLRNYSVLLTEITIPFEKKLERGSSYQAMNYLRTMTPKDSIVLSIQPSEMFYSKRRMISHLDPRLIDFYKEKNPLQARQLLHQLGIHYIHVPNYSMPTLSNSALQEILNDSNLSELAFSSKGFQIYRINATKSKDFYGRNLVPGQMPWTKTIHYILPGRQESFCVYSESEKLENINRYFFNVYRERQLSLWSGIDNDVFEPIKVDEDKEYLLKIDLKGAGFITTSVMELDDKNKVIGIYQIDKIILSSEDNVKSFCKRIVTGKNTSSIRIGLKTQGMFKIEFEKLFLKEVGGLQKRFEGKKGGEL